MRPSASGPSAASRRRAGRDAGTRRHIASTAAMTAPRGRSSLKRSKRPCMHCTVALCVCVCVGRAVRHEGGERDDALAAAVPTCTGPPPPLPSPPRSLHRPTAITTAAEWRSRARHQGERCSCYRREGGHSTHLGVGYHAELKPGVARDRGKALCRGRKRGCRDLGRDAVVRDSQQRKQHSDAVLAPSRALRRRCCACVGAGPIWAARHGRSIRRHGSRRRCRRGGLIARARRRIGGSIAVSCCCAGGWARLRGGRQRSAVMRRVLLSTRVSPLLARCVDRYAIFQVARE